MLLPYKAEHKIVKLKKKERPHLILTKYFVPPAAVLVKEHLYQIVPSISEWKPYLKITKIRYLTRPRRLPPGTTPPQVKTLGVPNLIPGSEQMCSTSEEYWMTGKYEWWKARGQNIRRACVPNSSLFASKLECSQIVTCKWNKSITFCLLIYVYYFSKQLLRLKNMRSFRELTI